MTQKQIKEQFKPGDRWQVKRETSAPIIVNGNTGITTLGNRDCDEIRTVKRIQGRCLVTIMPNGREIDTEWPFAGRATILEAGPGFLKFQYTPGPLVTMTKAA